MADREQFNELIATASAIYSVPESWIRAVIEVESSWNPDAFNPSDPGGARGLMQITWPTALGLHYSGDPDGLFDPATNIDLGSMLLGQLRDSYGDDFRRVYSAYNSGNPDRWETSTQVANNVSRAIAALQKYVTETAGQIMKSDSGAAVVGLFVLVLMWAFSSGGKRR